MERKTVLYVAAILPARSETFVYRELFALRECGLQVMAASINPSDRQLGSKELEALADQAIPVYGTGLPSLLRDAFFQILRHPLRSFGTFGRVIGDFILADDVHGSRRLKIFMQGVAAHALAWRLKSFGIFHIHAHMAHVPTTIAMYTARLLGVSFSFTGHANDIFTNRSLLKQKLSRALFVSCISRWHREFYKSIFVRDDVFFPVIRCGVDTRREVYIDRASSEEFKILAVGRLVEKKGFDILITAVSRVASQASYPIVLSIAGSGPEDARLRSLAAGLPQNAKIHFLGATDNDRVMSLMADCDLFALPLRVTAEGDRDGIPVVLMEAMARGRCVVSGDLVTIRELIDEGQTGFLVPPGNAEALSSVILKLMADRQLITQTGRNARQKIVAEFDTLQNAHALIGVMRRLGLPV